MEPGTSTAAVVAGRCPDCGVEVGATWRWCLACGYDPDGSAGRVRRSAGRSRHVGWRPVAIVLAGLLVGGLILWRTTPHDGAIPGLAGPAYEVTSWERFRPDNGAFEVELPLRPEVQPPSGAPSSTGRLIEHHSVEQGPLHIQAMVFDTRLDGVPLKDEEDLPLLGIFGAELATAYQGKPAQSRKADIGRHPGREYVVNEGMRGDLQAKAVLVGQFLYAIVLAGTELPEPVVRHVFDSFRVTS